MNEKIYGVIDVGSNSVRTIVYADGKILYRGLITTRLGEGFKKGENLNPEASKRTLTAILTLKNKCVEYGASTVFAFATEAVRSASDGKQFASCVYDVCGIPLDIVSGDEEGELGLLGALCGGDGGIIDIGGASAEIAVAYRKKIIYGHSLPLGAVRLKDTCGEDVEKMRNLISERICEYGKVPKEVDYRFIGGTATALGMVALNMEDYDADEVDGFNMSYDDVLLCFDKISKATIEERVNKLHISPKRAEIIVGGVCLLLEIMKYSKIDSITISDNDNLMGYLRKRVFGESYEK